MTPVGVFFCWQGGAERDFVNSTNLRRVSHRGGAALAAGLRGNDERDRHLHGHVRSQQETLGVHGMLLLLSVI